MNQRFIRLTSFNMMWSCPWWGSYGGSYWVGWISLLSFIAWWVFIIAVITYVVRWLRKGRSGHADTEPSALELLKIRYAKGEIDKQEFEAKKKDLEA